jgi:hypothetical protein
MVRVVLRTKLDTYTKPALISVYRAVYWAAKTTLPYWKAELSPAHSWVCLKRRFQDPLITAATVAPSMYAISDDDRTRLRASNLHNSLVRRQMKYN